MRLLPAPWPSDALPPPTASLLAISSQKGLLAAAGPTSVIIASTESVREAYHGSEGGNLKTFSPQLTLDLGTRVSHVAFSANDEFLILSAEVDGGLAIYEVQALLLGNKQSAFELATNNIAVRALVPNPTDRLIAVINANGQLFIADLAARAISSSGQNQILKDNVSCVSWSNKGKQLVAGHGNGTCTQLTPKGDTKAELPVPANIEGEHYGRENYSHLRM